MCANPVSGIKPSTNIHDHQPPLTDINRVYRARRYIANITNSYELTQMPRTRRKLLTNLHKRFAHWIQRSDANLASEALLCPSEVRKAVTMRRELILLLGIVIVVSIAGGSYIYLANQSRGMYFVVDVLGERFTMLVTDQQAIQDALDNMNGLNNIHPIGVLDFGDGGFNQPWGWHYKPETVAMTAFSTEVCDAEPHFVQENLGYWVNTVKYYCPWAAKIISASQTVPIYAGSANPVLAMGLAGLPTLALWAPNRLA